MRSVKGVAEEIAIPPAEILNVSVAAGVVPDALKLSRVTPVPKSEYVLAVYSLKSLSRLCVNTFKVF